MAAGLARYRALFAVPGTRAFCAAAFMMRMPIAMYPIGIVLIVSARDGRYGFAGVLSACYVVAGGVGMPATAVLVDRYGQRRVLLPAAAFHACAVAALAIAIHARAADAVLIGPTVGVGLSYLSVGSLSRARWSHALAGRDDLPTAMSLESVLDEVIFVVGPLVATLIATQTVPVAVLYLTLALVVLGSLWLASLHATEPPAHPSGDGHPFALRSRGMLLLTATTVPIGGVFASIEVSAVAYCGQHGHRGLSGLALAAVAAGSAVSGLVYGAREHLRPVFDRFRRQAIVFAVLPVVLLAVFGLPSLVVADAVVGLGIAPALICAFELVQRLVPTRSLTEGLTWINTGLSVGYGAGASAVGGIADAHGARAAFLVVIGSALLAGAMASVLHTRLAATSTPAAA